MQDFDVVLKRNPNNSTFFSYRANAHSELKEYEKAIADWTQVIRLNSQNPIASQFDTFNLNFFDAIPYYNRGLNYNSLGAYNKAIGDFTQAILLNSLYSAAYNNRGISYKNLGEYDKAIADYNQAISLNPQYADAYFNRGYSYKNLGEYDKAIADYRQAADLYQLQGNTENFQKVLSFIEEIEKLK
ncbi:MAG: tetratricopeptide repeat protein [Hydrococcus sp. SU_1_0]|nr:tetratricopeptide repeat protein [Hydrococcus sp. SU_1_0]